MKLKERLAAAFYNRYPRYFCHEDHTVDAYLAGFEAARDLLDQKSYMLLQDGTSIDIYLLDSMIRDLAEQEVE